MREGNPRKEASKSRCWSNVCSFASAQLRKPRPPLSLSLSPSFDLPLSSPALWPDPGLTCAAEDGSVSGVVLPRALLVFLIGPTMRPKYRPALHKTLPSSAKSPPSSAEIRPVFEPPVKPMGFINAFLNRSPEAHPPWWVESPPGSGSETLPPAARVGGKPHQGR